MRIIQDSREQAPYAFAASRYAETVVLCFAPGVLASEKQAALLYAVDHWQALLADMALPADGCIRHCWIEGCEGYCRPGNVKEAAAC